MTKWKVLTGAVLLGIFSGTPRTGHAQSVANGSFSTLSSGYGQLGFNTNATGWSVATPPGSYTFAFDYTSATNQVGGQYGSVGLWTNDNGGSNGFSSGTVPGGGNFIGMDADFQPGAISQTITGLTVGQTYDISFDWAAAQQYGFNGSTGSNWTVSLGGQSYTTATDSIGSQGFSGWQGQTYTYTATSSSEVLSFLAGGPTSGEPPFALLTGVNMMVATPESSSLSLMFGGLLGIGAFGALSRLRKRTAKSIA